MRVRIFAFLCLLLALVACGGATDEAPVNQVKAFVAATEARDVDAMIALLTPDTRRDAGWQLRQVMGTVSSIEYREPTYELGEVDGDTAFVQVSGTVIAAVEGSEPIEQPLLQLVELQQIDGTWYISSNGLQIPQTLP